MAQLHHYQTTGLKRKIRVRSKIKGSTQRPRLSFFRSNQHIYMQIINDETGLCLFSVSDVKMTSADGTKTEKSKKVAKHLAEELSKRNIKAIVIDRGACKYHGRIKAAVEVIREAGVEV